MIHYTRIRVNQTADREISGSYKNIFWGVYYEKFAITQLPFDPT